MQSNQPVGPTDYGRQPDVRKPRSTFDMTSRWLGTVDGDVLVPIFIEDVLPGDSWNINLSLFARMTTPQVAYMDNIYAEVFWFACSDRLLQSNWVKLQGEQTDPGDSTSFVTAKMTVPAGGFTENSLGDYFGLPTKVAGAGAALPMTVRSAPFRFYNKTFNEWFRDENLVDSRPLSLGDGPDTLSDYTLQKRMKQPDYLTSCLPFLQKGTAAGFGLSGTADVVLNPTTGLFPVIRRVSDHAASGPAQATLISDGDGRFADGVYGYTVYDPMNYNSSVSTLQADLGTASGATFTINELREAEMIQVFLETNARFGTRYPEMLRGRWGVVSSDARQQRVEYLGSSSHFVNQHPVAQTSETGTTPQGGITSFATVSGRSGFTKSFEEHSWVMGILNFRASQSYQQGERRLWRRSTDLDFALPEFAHLGEQSVLSSEIYVDGTADDDDVFGYQERFGDYRGRPSLITSGFRSNATTPLDFWHLAQDFSARPVLDTAFKTADTPFDRIVAVPTEPHFYVDAYFTGKAARVLPVRGVPGLGKSF